LRGAFDSASQSIVICWFGVSSNHERASFWSKADDNFEASLEVIFDIGYEETLELKPVTVCLVCRVEQGLKFAVKHVEGSEW